MSDNRLIVLSVTGYKGNVVNIGGIKFVIRDIRPDTIELNGPDGSPLKIKGHTPLKLTDECVVVCT